MQGGCTHTEVEHAMNILIGKHTGLYPEMKPFDEKETERRLLEVHAALAHHLGMVETLLVRHFAQQSDNLESARQENIDHGVAHAAAHGV